jgi:hypothetical protein
VTPAAQAVAAVAGLLIAPWAIWSVVKEMRR